MKQLSLSLATAALLGSTLVACYGAAPGIPPHIPLPPPHDDAAIDVRSESVTTVEEVDRTASSCPTGHGEGDPACVVTHYKQNEPVTRTKSTATYGDTPISYAQLRVMADDHRDQKLATLDDLSTKCRHANIPRYAGMALALGGVIAGALVKGSAGAGLIYGGLGAGGGSYALGYFAFGGRDCNEAATLYGQLDVSNAVSWNEVYGAEYAVEMKKLAEEFNARAVAAGRAAQR